MKKHLSMMRANPFSKRLKKKTKRTKTLISNIIIMTHKSSKSAFHWTKSSRIKAKYMMKKLVNHQMEIKLQHYMEDLTKKIPEKLFLSK